MNAIYAANNKAKNYHHPEDTLTTNTAISLWDTSATEPDVGTAMDGDCACDVAIIGGGYTGLSTALHAAEKGLNCHVLEAETIGFGGSGRNVGLVNAGLWLAPQDVHALMGETNSKPLINLLGAMPDYVFSLIEKHKIQCEAHRNGTIHAAHAPRGLKDLERRATGWQQMGVDVDLLSAEQVAEKTGATAFYGGLLDRRAGTVNPMGYTRGLARAAHSAGARISTHVRAKKLTQQGGLWRVKTDCGVVTAKHVVVATNAYSDNLWPGLRQSHTMINFFQLSTPPLGDRAVHILQDNQGLWTTAQIMFSLRRDNFGRLIIGSMGAVHGGTEGLSKRWAAKTLARLFPDLGPVEFDNAWHGRIAMTPDHIFRIHRPADGLYVPTGYNGRGIITGTMFGQSLAELMTGASEDCLPLPVSEIQTITDRRLKNGLFQAAFAANQFLKSI